MNTHLKIRADLLKAIREDLDRPHCFARERVGFVFANLSRLGEGALMILARIYATVDDKDYIDDPNVGAMMGPAAIRKALQLAYQTRTAALHVHMHGHAGRPAFSGIDLRENAKFVPNFFNVAPRVAHGAVVLSRNSAAGQLWLKASAPPIVISRFSAIGAPLGLNGVFQ